MNSGSTAFVQYPTRYFQSSCALITSDTGVNCVSSARHSLSLSLSERVALHIIPH